MELEEEMLQGNVGGRKVLCDGLLCSILHGMSSAANEDEFISVIERDTTENDILEARRKLFTYYDNEICAEQKKPILQVTRSSVNRNIKDIVTQMVKIDKKDCSDIFYMPWDYKLKPFKTDTARRAEKIEMEIANDVEMKFDALENKMEEKNRTLVDLIECKFNEVLRRVSTGPIAAAQPEAVGQGQAYGGARPRDGQQAVPGGGVGGRGAEEPRAAFSWAKHVKQGMGRGRSPSIKRRRGQDGDDIEEEVRAPSLTRPKLKKFVVGTSNAASTVRKMKSPPADIFIYGVHTATSVEDIIADLADSDIIVSVGDVFQKSRPEAPLKSFKISVKAEDLEKALNPAIWPMRIKVREFIHYARKNPRQETDREGGNRPNHDQTRRDGAHGDQPRRDGARADQHRRDGAHGGVNQQVHEAAQDGHSQHDQGHAALSPNKYAMPEDQVPGGWRKV